MSEVAILLSSKIDSNKERNGETRKDRFIDRVSLVLFSTSVLDSSSRLLLSKDVLIMSMWFPCQEQVFQDPLLKEQQ